MKTLQKFLLIDLACMACWLPACGSQKQPAALTSTVDHFLPATAADGEASTPPLDEQTFRRLIKRAVDSYQALAAEHGARIVLRVPLEAKVSKDCEGVQDEDSIMHCSWQSDFSNADSGRSREDPKWFLGMGGGLARLPGMNEEGFTLVICHEMGHLFGGYPYLREGFTGLALPVSVDGQADYFAAQVCARRLWSGEDNAKNQAGVAYRQLIEPAAADLCTSSYTAESERQLCYKTLYASATFVKALVPLSKDEPVPSVSTPDPSEVSTTDSQHPLSQCRLDTFVAGALCPTVLQAGLRSAAVVYDESNIPGYDSLAPSGVVARTRSMAVSCRDDFMPRGQRPKCWFNPVETDEGGWMSENF